MKKYYFGWTSKDCIDCGTEKACCFTYAGGYTTANDKVQFVPRSIMRVDEPNEYGNCKVYIPVWFFTKNFLDHRRIREIDWGENGTSELVELSE